VLLRFRGGDGLSAVLARVAGDIDDMDLRIGEQGFDVIVGLDLAAVLGAERGGIERMWAVAAQP